MNRLQTTLSITALIASGFSQLAIANRPASEEALQEMPQPATPQQESTQSLQQEPSAVELMMQQESRQTGDIITLPPKEMQAGETISIRLLDSPRRGMSMDKVKNEFGQPASISDSVGNPPITRWTYSDRIVYFEYATVIHVVAR